MRLLTDHPQWYDGIFDGGGLTFHRVAFARGGLPKRAQLGLFERMGLRTPPHGTVRALFERMSRPEELRCVVYEDELEHCGRGKRLLPLAEAARTHPDCYATLFVPPAGRASIVRHARIGRLGFWLRQRARDGDWRSNGDDEERFLGRSEHPEPNPVPRVLWAIDFLPTPLGLLAIDFNTAPELSTLGEQRAATEAEIRAELELAPPQHLEQL